MDINAILTIPPDEVEIMKALSNKLDQYRALSMGRDILTHEEACLELKVSDSTLRRWRDEGWLPFFSEGKIKKYERQAILEAYKLKFGESTHFKVLQEIQLNSRRRKIS